MNIQKQKLHLRGGGAHPLHPPPRSAPASVRKKSGKSSQSSATFDLEKSYTYIMVLLQRLR